MEWINIIIGAVSGGALATLLTLPSVIKKAKAEARAADIDNLQKAMDGWHALADERQEANRERDQVIKEMQQRNDELQGIITERYSEIGEWRNRYHEACESISQLKIEAAKNAVKHCEKRACTDRTPPTGY